MPLGLADINPPHVELYQRQDGKWDWRLIAGNGELVCSTDQGYTSKDDAERGLETAQRLLAAVTDVRSA